jgi:hypothetical protein
MKAANRRGGAHGEMAVAEEPFEVVVCMINASPWNGTGGDGVQRDDEVSRNNGNRVASLSHDCAVW